MSFFDEVIERRGSNSKKWHSVIPEVQSMWLADMDFRAPEPILFALSRIVQHGILGYPIVTDSFYQAVINWYGKRYDVRLQADNITPQPFPLRGHGFLVYILRIGKADCSELRGRSLRSSPP